MSKEELSDQERLFLRAYENKEFHRFREILRYLKLRQKLQNE